MVFSLESYHEGKPPVSLKPLLSVAELAELLDDPNLRLFDATVEFSQQADGSLAAVAGLKSYEAEHIPGAAFFDHMDAFADTGSELRNTLLPIDDLHRAMGQAGIGPDHRVVLYSSQYLMWATRAWWMLHYAGHNNVYVLNGGLSAWKNADHDTVTGSNSYPATQFSAEPRPERYADKAKIAAAIDGPACTIDALPAQVYRGESPNNYGRPGHIPGAANLPYHHLQEGEAYLPPDQLKTALAERGMLDAEQVYTYCGGGIAATVDALACLMAGQTNVAVYDGSMSEWNQDSEAPIKAGPNP